MPQLLIHSASGDHRMTVAEGLSVREALDLTTLRVRAACGGSGTCGACGVHLLEGQVSPLTLAEYLKISPEEREAGLRLACQLRLRGDAEIRIDQPAPPSPWKSIPPDHLQNIDQAQVQLQSCIYGVAVDLGTTHIRLSLWDMKQGKRIASRYGPNPQGSFGADVLNRLEAAHIHPEHETELASLARTAILQALRDILARDVGEVSPMLAEIGQVLIVGNSAMLALLSGQGRAALLAPENWESPIDCLPADSASWQALWHMPHARIQLAHPAAGFVGSDLLADLLATQLTDGPGGALLLDIGTNTEIALWDGRHLHLTSVPGGPAFEAVGIRHGMPAEPGAICAVQPGDRTGGKGYRLTTLGDDVPRGFCGSGLLDAIAVLLKDKILKPSGRFTQPPGPEGHRLDPALACSAITGVDIDAFQRAKAAMAAAMEQLLELAGMDWSQLTRLCICGAFGHTLQISHAQALGLLPLIAPERIELHADASLAGCERALLTGDSQAALGAFSPRIRMVNLALLPDYENRYIDHLRLRPITASAAPTTKQ